MCLETASPRLDTSAVSNLGLEPGFVTHVFSLKRLRQENHYKFEASLDYWDSLA